MNSNEKSKKVVGQETHDLYTVSVSPHLSEHRTVSWVMWNVVAALIPALVVGICLFGPGVLYLTVYGVIAAVLCEAFIQFWRKKPISVSDGSAVITGMLVAFNLHAAAPWWIPVLGSVFAIAIGKHVFGGLGHNPMNPALVGRVFLVASFPTMTAAGWIHTVRGSISGITSNINIDAIQTLISSATPMAVIKSMRDPVFIEGINESIPTASRTFMNEIATLPTIQNLFWGNVGGCIGEVSAAVLILGALWLAWKRIIEWRIPSFYILTVFVLTYIFGGIDGIFSAPVLLPFFHIFGGGLMLGALFMATDMVTSPLTKKGRIVFGIGCGFMTVVIRLVGGFPEGVTFAILLMNLLVPLIDKYTKPKPFGELKAVKG